MKYFKQNKKSAQSFLEYSLIISVCVAALIIMQYYFGRSAQGLLKQNVDNLGSEKLTGGQFTPGKWYGASTVTRIGTSDFEYEGRKGFNIKTGTMQRSSVSRMTGSPSASELPTENLQHGTTATGEQVGLAQQVLGGQLDPGIGTVQTRTRNNNGQWAINSGNQQGQENDIAAGIDSEAEGIANRYIPEEKRIIN